MLLIIRTKYLYDEGCGVYRRLIMKSVGSPASESGFPRGLIITHKSFADGEKANVYACISVCVNEIVHTLCL